MDIAIERCGLVSSVGLHASSACAAMRCRLNNFSETAFQLGPRAKVIGAALHAMPTRGAQRLFLMAKDALDQAAEPLGADERINVPLLACLAEHGRPGRLPDLDRTVVGQLQAAGYGVNPHSRLFAQGKSGLAEALQHTQSLFRDGKAQRALIVAVDSLLNQRTVQALLSARRLQGLAGQGSGLIPGEGAGALLVSAAQANAALRVIGIGMGTEEARLNNDIPVRGQGLKDSVERALEQAGLDSTQLGLRVADLSGETFYFEDAALAMMRLSAQSPMPGTLWLPAESLGDTGAASGAMALAWLHEAARRNYTDRLHALCHFSDDDGRRTALIARLSFHESHPR